MPSTRTRTPRRLRINAAPRRHVVDPTLGVPVEVDRTGTPPNRLVTLGDSITQGFMSAAVYRTDRSWPAMVAHELGLVPQQGFRYPSYEPTSGPGGLPIDLERAVRHLGSVIGDRLDWYEVAKAARRMRSYMDRIEDYWEGRGDNPFVVRTPGRPYHNLAVYGADLVDVQVLNRRIIDARLQDRPHDDFVKQVVEHDERPGVAGGVGELRRAERDGARRSRAARARTAPAHTASRRWW